MPVCRIFVRRRLLRRIRSFSACATKGCRGRSSPRTSQGKVRKQRQASFIFWPGEYRIDMLDLRHNPYLFQEQSVLLMPAHQWQHCLICVQDGPLGGRSYALSSSTLPSQPPIYPERKRASHVPAAPACRLSLSGKAARTYLSESLPCRWDVEEGVVDC